MRDFQLLAAQIRAARGLLGWSQTDLAEAAKVGRATIADLEGGKREPHESTMYVIMSELAGGGVVFTETGVEFREWPPYVSNAAKKKNRK